MCSDGMSSVMWIGRVGKATPSPCGDNAPVSGSMCQAVTWCFVPVKPPTPEALSLDAT
jgi:hypothetical protein